MFEEILLGMLFLRPYRCQACEKRFYGLLSLKRAPQEQQQQLIRAAETK